MHYMVKTIRCSESAYICQVNGFGDGDWLGGRWVGEGDGLHEGDG